MHLLDRLAGDFGVVLRLAQILGHLGVPKLEVRHVNIHHPVQEPQGLHGIVAPGVVDQGNVEAAGDGRRQRRQDLVDLVAGGDEIDIVAAPLLEIEHHGGQILDADLLAFPPVADLVVLAKNAVQVAVGEKDGAGPLAAHQGVFLAEMGPIRRHHGLIPGAAQPQLPVMPVHQAVPGTEIALAQNLISRINLRLEQPPAMRL